VTARSVMKAAGMVRSGGNDKHIRPTIERIKAT
jgi:hypothetical protein